MRVQWYGLLGFMAAVTVSAPSQEVQKEEVEPLTRGVIHEAFASPVVYDPKPGPVVPVKPPEPIEELPPDQKPEGENVAWVPGYWSFDDERSDYIWVSGIWRTVPPGRQWVPGYWNEAEGGWSWVSGFWRPSVANTVTYHPDPPASLEAGPSSPDPSDGRDWVPGTWVWSADRYLWSPGYWIPGRSGWVWTPASWVWTPSGCVFVGGYWDYDPTARGVLFAPCSIALRARTRTGFVLTPYLTINLGLVWDHCFVWPRYRHYCFGDYYGVPVGRGIVPWFQFQRGRVGYDPLYVGVVAHHHRNDRAYLSRMRDNYDFRLQHPQARPARTWATQRKLVEKRTILVGKRQVDTRGLALGRSFEEARRDKGTRYRPISIERRREDGSRAGEVRRFAEQRRRAEIATPKKAAARPLERPTPRALPRTAPERRELPRTAPERRELPRSPVRSRPDPGVRPPNRPVPPEPRPRTRLPERRGTQKEKKGERSGRADLLRLPPDPGVDSR